MLYRFDDHELDVDAHELRRGGERVTAQPKVFDVLRYLLEHAGTLVTKQALLEALWPGEHITEGALSFNLSRVRHCIGQTERNYPIETVYGRGLRFVAPVEVEAEHARQPQPAKESSASVLAGPDTFVGRAGTMDRLTRALEAAEAGHGSLHVLTGEAGIGKTRCLQELARIARGKGLYICWGRGLDGSAAPVLSPWAQVLASLVRAGGEPPSTGPSVEVLTELESSASGTASSEPPESRRLRTMRQITGAILGGAARAPLLLLLDDLQWMDELSLSCLASLCAELPLHPVLVVGTARQSERLDPPARAALAQAMRGARRHGLDRLGNAEALELTQLQSGGAVQAKLATLLCLRSGGNPLFLIEMIRELMDRHGGGLAEVDAADIPVPDVAAELIGQRVAALPEPLRALLTQASVLGDHFSGAGLERTVEDRDGFWDHLEALFTRGLLRDEGGDTIAFAHPLLREVAYQSLGRAERARCHLRAADALGGAQASIALAELAFHLHEAQPESEPERVLEACRRAGRAAVTVGAFADAARYYGWALSAEERKPEPNPRVVAELLTAEGFASISAGRWRRGRQSHERAVDLSLQHQYGDVLARIGIGLRSALLWNGIADPLALRALEASVSLLGDDRPELRASALARLANIPPHSRVSDTQRALLDEAEELARRSGDERAQLGVMRARLAALLGPDHLDELERLTGRAIELDPVVGGSGISADARYARYYVALQRGDGAAADGVLDALSGLVSRANNAHLSWDYARMKMHQRLRRGDYEAALEQARRLDTDATRLYLPLAGVFHVLHQAVVIWERKGAAALIEHEDLWARLHGQRDINPLYASLVARLMTEANASKEHAEQAAAALDEARRSGFESIRHDLDYLGTLANFAVVAVRLADRQSAVELRRILEPYAELNATSTQGYAFGSVSRYLGTLAAAVGDTTAALAHLEHALLRDRALASPHAEILNLLALSALLDATGAPARAAASRDEAARIAQNIGVVIPS